MIPLQIDAIQKSTCLYSRQRTEYEHIGWTCNVTKLTHPQGQNTLNEEPVTNPKQKIILVCSCKLERPYTRKTGNHWRARNCPPLPEYQKPNCTRRRLYQPFFKKSQDINDFFMRKIANKLMRTFCLEHWLLFLVHVKRDVLR